MSFPRYPAYKPSSVEWLGEVPEHWQEKPLKTITSINDEVLSESLSPDYEIEYVDIGSVSLANGIEKTEAMPFGDAPSRARRIPRDGDVLVSTVRTYLKAIAPVVNPPLNLVASTGFAVVRPRHELEPGFLKYALQEEHFIQQVISRSTGVSYPAINASDVAKISLNLPESSEQLAIATFLDHETAKIDALIAEQQRLIELLQEKRQAVISHAVTKGLNPDAPMKDSGVEWLGEVPEHWEVKPLKYLITLTSGGTPSKENLAYWSDSVPWASSKDLKTEELFDTQDHISQQALDDGAAALIPTGSILTVVRGMILLHTFPVVVTHVPMAINQDLKAITPLNEIATGYLAWLLRGASREVLGRVDEAGHGTKVLRIDSWLAMHVPVPPAIEQELIVPALVKSLREVDALIDQSQRAISLLQERRSALISAAVTGQIDLRGLVPEAVPA
jgi:type I restriction enzyme, S subunit